MSTIEAVLPLTRTQRGIHVVASSDPESYVAQWVVEVRADWSLQQVAAAWLDLQQHHAALRSHLSSFRGVPVLVVPSGAGPSPSMFDVSAAPGGRRREASRICDDELDRGVHLETDPLIRLTVIRVEDDCLWFCLTHHHLGLDGLGVRTTLDDLVRRCSGQELRLAARLDVVLRSWLEDDAVATDLEEDRVSELCAGERLSSFVAEQSARMTRVRTFDVDTRALEATAVAASTSPAVVVIAAWACTLRAVRPSCVTPIPVTVDRRGPLLVGYGPTVGMLVDTLLALEVVTVNDSPASVSSRLAERLSPPVRLAHLATSTERARRAGASGTPDTLITVYSEARTASTPAAVELRPVRVTEETEFAVDVTARLSDVQVRIDLQYDALRVEEQVMDGLVSTLKRLLLAPHSTVADTSGMPLPGTTGPQAPIDLSHDVRRVVIEVASSVVGTSLDLDQDLYATGVDSLTFLQIAVALRRLGHDIGVGALIEAGSVRGIARHLAEERAPRTLVLGEAAPASPIENGYLRLTSDVGLGPAPMHEQSVLTFHGRLDAARLGEALDSCLERLPSLARTWRADGSLVAPTAVAQVIDIVEARDSTGVRAAARDLLRGDLARPFQPGGGSLLRVAAVCSDEETSLLLTFHQAVLDGWSFATFVRSVQLRYVDLRRHLAAEDSAEYRRWATTDDHDAEGLARLLRGLRKTSRRSLERPSERARGAARDPVSGAVVHEAARRLGTSDTACLAASVGLALRRVLEWPDSHALGLRSTVRDGSRRSGLRTVGQLTVDMPVPQHDRALAAGAHAVRTAFSGVHRHGHLGQEAIDAVLGASADAGPALDTVLVTENYFGGDEHDLRGLDRDAWREKASWRRDVSASPRTITAERGPNGWAIEVDSVIDADPAELATTIVAEVMSTMREVVP